MSQPPQHLISAQQVAERCGVTVFTVAKWARSGKLRTAYKFDGRTGPRLFDPADVDAIAAREAVA